MSFPSDLVPPGTHIAAELNWQDAEGAQQHTQLRILGDDTRGYLLMGAFVLPNTDGQEFWFPTIDEAKTAAAELGLPREAWSEVTAVSQVRLRR